MTQQVDITLKLSLWLDATMNEDEIVTHVRSALPNAFGDELTEMKNPVDILDVRQEAAIYGEKLPGAPTDGPWVAWRLAPDSDPQQRHIITTADGEQEITGIIEREEDAHHLVRCVNTHEGLLRALSSASRWIDAQLFVKRTEIQETIRQAIASATGRAA